VAEGAGSTTSAALDCGAMEQRDKPEHLTPEVIAVVAAERFGDAWSGLVHAAMRQDLTRRIEAAIAQALRAERQRAAGLCLARQQLWETTESRPDTSEPLRLEARNRANEAAYLADLLQEG
jgi:hypothetical protein